jgi:hypothetical protein
MNAITKTDTSVNVNYETVDQVGIGVIGILSAIIGTWGVACLIGGLCQYGIVGMIKGWVSAITGI